MNHYINENVHYIRVLSEPLNDFNDGRCPGSKLRISEFLYLATPKVAGYNVIPSKPFECPFVCLSGLRFRAPTLVS